MIVLPFVGKVQVNGMSLDQIEQRIAQQAKDKARDPQVIVDIVADRTNGVMVSGDVRAPGRYSLLDGVRSVLDAINKAGGPAASPELPPSQLQVTVRRHDQVILQKQFPELLAGADIPIQKGDDIIVKPHYLTFTAMGAIRAIDDLVEETRKNAQAGPGGQGGGTKPLDGDDKEKDKGDADNKGKDEMRSANIPITKQGMTLLDALGAVGGLSDQRSAKRGVFVFRFAAPGSTQKSQVFKLDMENPVSLFVAQQFGIKPNDAIYITNAPLYEYNRLLLVAYQALVAVRMTTGTTTGIGPVSGF
jgi:polysaccharide export outer membrane protein